MEPISIREILTAVDGQLLGEFSDLDHTITHVFIDSRKPDPEALFIPLVGERFDGHAFIHDALLAGAGGCFTQRERDSYLPDKFYIKVGSTQRALRDLARYYKEKFPIPFIGITGSVGKTTTKDMVAAVLGEKYKVLKTDGNFNNEIGLPLTLLRLNSQHQICVLEMGMSDFGEIEYLSKLVEPDMALITNIGDAHIEFLGTQENILKAKSEMFNHMKEGSLVVLNGDDPLLQTLHHLPFQIRYCGMEEGLDYRATQIQSDDSHQIQCQLESPKGAFQVSIPALGKHMIYPTLMATTVAQQFGMTEEEIARGILRFAPTKMRMNILRREEGITILDDCYNANPQSMRAAVEVLSKAGVGYKIAILGDMFELGDLAPALHEGVGAYLGKAGIDCLIAIGALAQHIYTAAKESGVETTHWFETKEEAVELLSQVLQPQCTVLVKGSRGLALEYVVNALKALTAEG